MNITSRQNLAWGLAAICALGVVVLGFVAWYVHEAARLEISSAGEHMSGFGLFAPPADMSI